MQNFLKIGIPNDFKVNEYIKGIYIYNTNNHFYMDLYILWLMTFNNNIKIGKIFNRQILDNHKLGSVHGVFLNPFKIPVRKITKQKYELNNNSTYFEMQLNKKYHDNYFKSMTLDYLFIDSSIPYQIMEIIKNNNYPTMIHKRKRK